MVEAQRASVLVTFDCLGQRLEALRRKVEFYQELAACEAWTALQFGETLRLQTGGVEKIQQIIIDRKIRQMDPDYSFSGEIWNEPVPSLLNRERPK